MEKKLSYLLNNFQRICSQGHQEKIAVDEIQRGKANLALLMTLPTSERDFWLIDRTRSQAFFELPDGSIVYYRDSVEPINHMRHEYLNSLNKVCDDVADKCSMYGKAYLDESSKKTLVDTMMIAASSLMQSLHDLEKPRQHCIGEICDSNGNIIEGRDLVDIYAQNQGLGNREDAVKSVFDHFNISDEVFIPVPIDERTNWSMKICPQNRQDEFCDPASENIVFLNHRTILGSVIVDNERGLIPRTVWRKGVHSKGVMLNVPFPFPMPLWNLPQMQDYPERTIILSDDLVAAFRAQREIENRIRTAKEKKREAILREKIYVPQTHSYDMQFEKKLQHDVLQEIDNEKYPLDSRYYDDSANELLMRKRAYWTARLAFILDAITEYGLSTISLKYPHNIKFLYYLIVNNDNKLTNDDSKYLQSIVGIPEQLKSSQGTPSQYNNQTPGIDKYIEAIYTKITEKIGQFRAQDLAKLKKDVKEIEQSEKFVFSSWFGGDETIPHITWKTLRNRNVIYIIKNHDEKSYITSVKVASALSHIAGRLDFYDHEVSKNEVFSSNDLREKAKTEFHIDVEVVNKNTYPQFIGLNTFGQEGEVEEVKYVLDKIISKRSTTLLFSPAGRGKTWFTLCLAQALCHGASVFENDKRWSASGKQRVVYIDSEMNQANFYRRVALVEEIYKRQNEESFPLKYRQVAPLNMNLVRDDEDDRDRAQIDAWLAAEEKEGRPVDLLILDNLSTLSGFNDTAKAWDNLAKWMKELNNRRTHPISCLVVHHSNKMGDQRGSSAKTATVDNVIYLEPQTGTSEQVYRKKPGCLNFIVHITKGRDIPDLAKQEFHFPVELNLTPGKESCTIVKPSKKEQGRIEEAIEYLQGGKCPPHEVIAMLTGLSVNTIKALSHKLRYKDKSKPPAKPVVCTTPSRRWYRQPDTGPE